MQNVICEVETWIGLQRGQLFSPALIPECEQDRLEHILSELWLETKTQHAQQRIHRAVNLVIARRAALVRTASLVTDIARGRCVLVNTYLLDAGGLGEHTGVVDSLDVPAWDFWTKAVESAEGCIIHSWVPQMYVTRMETAISMSATSALSWCTECR